MDLTCYVHPSWAPRLRPASSKRPWMDATAERFAYRCLPLAIANAHGWELGSPCAFEARWNGGYDLDSIEIRLDPGYDGAHAPVSLFGNGTITFHVEGIFRTPPGWNLWVSGMPNEAKHGIAPLAGVIETDWSPYSFTMNWRFTRAGEWVRWEEDEPFCFFFPVQRGVLETIEPSVRPLSEAPELEAAFRSWSASRDAFQEHVRRTKPTAPADKWQKLYYRGIGPDGEPGPDDHQAKLRVPGFDDTTGQCPVHRGGSVRKPEPAVPSAPAIEYNGNVALARRDWILRTMERQRALSPETGGLSRVAEITADEFLEYFYAQSRPVVIEGEMEGWPVLERWTPDYLAQRVGKAPVEFQGGRTDNPGFELEKDKHKQSLPFDAFLDLLATPGNDAYLTAYNSAANQKALAPLIAELGQFDKFLTPGDGMLWIGPEGSFTPLHHDLTNNLLAQVVGHKKLHLIPPSETSKLANSRHVFSDVHDILDPDCLERFPQARSAQYFEVDLYPGDLLYIPVGWWHQVRSLSFSVMLTYTNFRWPNDAFRDFPADR